jgi:hypothetical protein
MKHLAAAIALLAVCSAASAQQGAAPVLTAAVAATQGARVAYAFDFQFDSAKGNLTAHFNPNASPHVTLTQPAEAQLNDDQRKVYDAVRQQLDGVSWCASERMGRIANMRVLREDADTTTYSFQPTPDSMRGPSAQFADRLRGELTMLNANPDIAAIHIFTAAGFDPMLFVHIDRVDIAISCATAPNGRRYAAQTISQTFGNAFGQAINDRNVQHVVNLSPAR